MNIKFNEIIIFITGVSLIIGGVALLVMIFFVEPVETRERVPVLLLAGYGCLSVGIFQLIAVIVNMRKRSKEE